MHWIAPVLSGLFTGFGIFSIFLSLLNYIVDAYLMFAASAIAGNTFMRSLCGGVFPLFATYMFNGMGIEWAATVCCVYSWLVYFLPPAPFLAPRMYGFYVHDADDTQLLGCVALLAVPMPVLFYIYGKKIRGKSKFAPAPDIEQDKRRDEEARLGGSDESTNAMNEDAEKEREREGSVSR